MEEKEATAPQVGVDSKKVDGSSGGGGGGGGGGGDDDDADPRE